MCYSISNFECPGCGNLIPLPRRNTKKRENGHIKDLFCPYCNKVQKTKEYKSNQPIRNMAGEIISCNR